MSIKIKSALAFLLMGSVVSTNATIARLNALGMEETDNEGSYYIEDNRNIFLNAASIHDYKDSMILEWGGVGKTFGSSSSTLDFESEPKAKGGFLKSHGDYVYGVYLGNASDTSTFLRGAATSAYAAQATLANASQGLVADSMLDGASNQVDFFFGGETAMGDWGANFVYTSGHSESTRKRDIAHGFRFGFKADRWDAFANISTRNKAKSVSNHDFTPVGGTFNGEVNHQFEGKLGFHIGGGYNITDNGKIYGFFKKFNWEQTDSGGTTAGFAAPVLNGRGQTGTIEGGFSNYAVGYGHTKKSGRGTLFTNIEYRSKSIDLEFTNKAEGKNVYIPVTVGYEYGATSWLTLRGSVVQKLWGYRKNNNYDSLSVIGEEGAKGQFGTDTGGKKANFENTTNINAGASINLGKLSIDGMIGTTAGDRAATASAEQGVFSTDNLLTRVAMTYNF